MPSSPTRATMDLKVPATTIQVREERLAGAPALVASAGAPERAARRGCVLVYHGLDGHKGLHVPELGQLARAGFVAVGVDAVGHGARRWPDFEARFGASDGLGASSFLEVVRATTAELPALVDALLARRWAVPGRVGIAGVSLGGFVAYGAATTGGLFAAAAPIVASPLWDRSAPDSPVHVPDRFYPTALLSVTSARDVVVPPGPVAELHATLAPRYSAAPERLRHLEWPDSGHMMEQRDWEDTWVAVIAWFDRHLG